MKSAPENQFFSVSSTLNIRGKLIDISKPHVMGILNVTPDSFHDGGKFTTESTIIDQTRKMLEEGATFIDVGAYSTRPGAADIRIEEEMKRAIGAIRWIVKQFPDAIISIDTFRSSIAAAAIDEGASIINDISASELDPSMAATVARLDVPYIIMHMRGTPATMKTLTHYENLIKDVTDYFHKKLLHFEQLGIKDLIIDPGFGFAKTIEQNFLLLDNLDYFKILGKPILAGLSRKSLIWRTLAQKPEDALNGTTALNTIALLKGVNILRVHDVKEALEAVKLVRSLHDRTD